VRYIQPYDKFVLNEIIRQEHGKFVVRTKTGDRKLGTHDTKEKALAQLRAIEASKSRRKFKK